MVSNPADDADDVLAALRDLSEPGGTVELSRWLTSGTNAGKWAYLERIPLADFGLEDIRQRHGGGRYRCRVVSLAGRYLEGGRVEVVIDGAPKVNTVPGSSSVTANPAVDPAVERLESLVRQLAAQQATPAVQAANPFAMMKDIIALVTGLLPLVRSDGSSAQQMLEMYFRGKEEAGRSGGGSSSMDWGPVLEIGREALEVIRTSSRNAPGSPAGAPVAVVQPPALEGSQPVFRRRPAPATQDRPVWFRALAPFAGMLVRAVQHDQDPAAVGNLLADWLDKTQGTAESDAVWSLLNLEPHLIDAELTAQLPAWQNLEVNARRAWLGNVAQAVVSQFEPVGNDGDTSEADTDAAGS